jgi:hypothetical protein
MFFGLDVAATLKIHCFWKSSSRKKGWCVFWRINFVFTVCHWSMRLKSDPGWRRLQWGEPPISFNPMHDPRATPFLQLKNADRVTPVCCENKQSINSP